jgi:hypothetical protein
VCTTNDALEDVVLRAVAPSQQQQLVFIQNGMLLPWLTTQGLQYNTQVLLYMNGEPGAAGAADLDCSCSTTYDDVLCMSMHGLP